MMASSIELDSFIAKFRYLCCAGFKSSLTISSENGQACVLFDVNLGALPVPVNLPPPRYCKQPRSPSYFRRQEKRRQERSNGKGEEAISISKVAETVANDDSAENAENYNEDVRSLLDPKVFSLAPQHKL